MKIHRGFGYVVVLKGDPFQRPVLTPVVVGVFSDSWNADAAAQFWRGHQQHRTPHVVTVVQWRIHGFKGARRVA